MKTIVAALSALAAFAAAPARAQLAELDFTAVVTDVRLMPDVAVGDVISGAFVLYPGSVDVTSTNGTTFAAAAHDSAAADPPLSRGTLVLADGTVLTTDLGAGQETEVDVFREDLSNPHGSFTGYTLTSDATGLTGNFMQIFVGDFLGAASSIFSTPAGDLSILQPVDWTAAGATSGGVFRFPLAPDHPALDFALTEAHFALAAPVPEPATDALLLAGLAATAWTARRQRSKTKG